MPVGVESKYSPLDPCVTLDRRTAAAANVVATSAATAVAATATASVSSPRAAITASAAASPVIGSYVLRCRALARP